MDTLIEDPAVTLTIDMPPGMYSSTTVEWRIAEFVRVLNAKEILRSAKREYQSRNRYFVDVPGQKFTRIYEDTGNQRMCFCFVENETGRVVKSGGWKTPAKEKSGFAYRWDLMDEADRHLLYDKVDAHGGVFYANVPPRLRKERDETS
jgi:hypothetical protein